MKEKGNFSNQSSINQVDKLEKMKMVSVYSLKWLFKMTNFRINDTIAKLIIDCNLELFVLCTFLCFLLWHSFINIHGPQYKYTSLYIYVVVLFIPFSKLRLLVFHCSGKSSSKEILGIFNSNNAMNSSINTYLFNLKNKK